METYDLIMTITDEAKKELSKTLARVNLDSGKYLRLTTPPVWAGEGDFGIVIDEMSEEGYLAGIKYDKNQLLVAVTEKRTKEEIDRYVSSLKKVINE
mgnify:CR=1 FL=1